MSSGWQPIETVPYNDDWVLLGGWDMGEPWAILAFWRYDHNDWYDSEAASKPALYGRVPQQWMVLDIPPEPGDTHV